MAWLATVLVGILVGVWAGRAATHPPQVQSAASVPETVAVGPGEVSLSQDYVVQASWSAYPVGANALSGTLTSLAVSARGSAIDPGTVVYTVNLQPVVVLRGAIPAFRDLGQGTKGPDVSQLQQFLLDTGRLRGAKPSGVFDAATASAVQAWTRSLGLPASSTVPLGRVVFLPHLPAHLAPATDTRVGMQVSPGSSILVASNGEPSFSFQVLPEAVATTRTGMRVLIDPPGGQHWQAQVRGLAPATDSSGGSSGGTIATLAPVAGQSQVCPTGCAGVVPVGGTASLPARLVQVAPTKGLQVPTTAVLSSPGGDACVVLADGHPHRVQVKAAAQGRSIIEGIDDHSRVVVNPSGVPGC